MDMSPRLDGIICLLSSKSAGKRYAIPLGTIQSVADEKPRNRSPGLYDDPMEIPKVKLRRTPSPTLKEIEKAEKRAKRAQRGYDDDCETEAERAKRKADRKREKDERARVTQLGPGDGGGLFDVTYVKKGGTREWDMGK
jgi:hypothetical protein